MSTGKKAGIIVGCIVAVVAIVIIFARPPGLPSVGPLGPKVSVDYEVTADGYLSVRVEGPETTYEVILFNPDMANPASIYISSNQMIPGHATVELLMHNLATLSPSPGEYWLIVKQVYPEERVFEAKPVFQGPDLTITNVQFRTDYYDYYYAPHVGDFYSTIEATVQVYNGGDLPVRPNFIRLSVAGDEQEHSTVFDRLPHGETTTVECDFRFDGLGRGTYPATVEIYSDGVKLDSYGTRVTIQ